MFNVSGVIRQRLFLRDMISEELSARADAVFSSPISVGIDYSRRLTRARSHLIAAERVGRSMNFAIAEIRLIGVAFCNCQPVSKVRVWKSFPGTAARFGFAMPAGLRGRG